MRRFFCLLLLICLPLQSFAAQIGIVRLAATGPAHQLAHVQDVHHHHHDDGAVHYDDSEESLQHSHDYSMPAQLLPASGGPAVGAAMILGYADPAPPASFIPDPFLDDPQRPPARAPGFAAGG